MRGGGGENFLSSRRRNVVKTSPRWKLSSRDRFIVLSLRRRTKVFAPPPPSQLISPPSWWWFCTTRSAIGTAIHFFYSRSASSYRTYYYYTVTITITITATTARTGKGRLGRRGESNLVTGLVEEKKRITTIGRVVAFTFFKGQFIIGLTLDGTMEIHFSTCDTRRIYNTLLLQEAGLLKIGNFFFFFFVSLHPLPSSPIRSNHFFFLYFDPKSSQRSNRYALSFISFLPSFFPPPPPFFLRVKSATKERNGSRSN